MTDAVRPSPDLHCERPAASAPQGLADQLELAAMAVNRTKTPMIISDPRQPGAPIVLANQAFLDLTGYTASEVIGRNPRFMQGAETDAADIAKIGAAVRDQREITISLLNYRKDGATFWNRLHISPIHDDQGRLLYFFGSQDDETELRRMQALEATERRLLKEVDHRARNVLAVVNGIVRLSRAEDAKAYALAVQQRVQALAAAHTLLAERGWQDVELDQIIRQQLDQLRSDRVQAAGPNVKVPAFVVQPLALVIHELLSNATAHGALSVPTGALTIRWDQISQTGGFELRWEEAHGPTPPLARRKGFGTTMLRSTIEKQLKGRVQEEWTTAGLVVTIKVPGASTGFPDPVAA